MCARTMKSALVKLSFGTADAEWLTNLAESIYAPYDKSHGMDHIQQVLDNAVKFMGDDVDAETVRTIAIICVLHDAYDPKYSKVHVMTRDELFAQVAQRFGEAEVVFNAIDNMSFTRERKGENVCVVTKGGMGERARRIAQFADWLTSVGEQGVIKSLLYNKHQLSGDAANGVTSDHVISAVVPLWESRFKYYLPVVTSALAQVELPAGVIERVLRTFERAHVEMEEILSNREKMDKLIREI